jgi:hypothetical protein
VIGRGFDVQIGENKVGITFESLLWFWLFTAIATVMGEIAYYYIQKYWLNGALPPTSGTVVTNAKL